MAGMFRQRSVLLVVAVLAIVYVVFSLYFPRQAYDIENRREISTKSGPALNATMATKRAQEKITSASTKVPSPDTVKPLPADAKEKEVLEWIRNYTNQLPNSTEVSVVTAYFNLGSLNKASSEGPYTPELYKKWMSVFAYLDNPLVVFSDTEETANYFRQLRARFPPARTNVIVVSRKELWAFQLEDEIKKVYAQPGYPRHQPNTVNPLYSCVMHAKFELVQKVIRERLYQTRFIAWLDIGLFRSEAGKKKTIHLTVPEDFDRNSVGYSKVYNFETLTPKQIIWGNKVWVGGASFLAAIETAYVYCSEYRRAVRKLLDMKMMSTDQQVIYSIFQPSFDFKPQFKIQQCTKQGANGWFSIGYKMKDAP